MEFVENLHLSPGNGSPPLSVLNALFSLPDAQLLLPDAPCESPPVTLVTLTELSPLLFEVAACSFSNCALPDYHHAGVTLPYSCPTTG